MNELSAVNILGAIGAVALLAYVAWDMPASIHRDGGKVAIRYNRPIRCCFLFEAFGIPLGLTLLAIVHRPKDEEEMWCLFFSYLLFAVLTVPWWWETSRFSLTISPEGLECRSPWRGRRFVPWTEVVRLSCSKVGKWYVVETRGGYRFRVPRQLIPGLDLFFAAMVQPLPGCCNWSQHGRPHLPGV